MVKSFSKYSNLYVITIPQLHGQTDRQTDRRPAAAIPRSHRAVKTSQLLKQRSLSSINSISSCCSVYIAVCTGETWWLWSYIEAYVLNRSRRHTLSSYLLVWKLSVCVSGAFLAAAVWGDQWGGQICILGGKNSGLHNTWFSEWCNLTPTVRCHTVNTGIM